MLPDSRGLPEINPAHPLARGLITYGLIIKGRPWDAKNKRWLTPAGTTGQVVTRRGVAATTSTGSGDLWTAPCAFPMSAKATGSVFVIAHSDASNTTRKRAFRLSNAASGTILALDYANGSANKLVGTGQVSGATFPDSLSTTVPAAGTLYSLLWCRSGATQDLYVNGAEDTFSETAPSANNWAADITDLIVGNSSSAAPLQGGVVYWGAWDRRLTAAEGVDLHLAPQAILRPIRSRAPVSAAGSGGNTIAVPAGSLTLTGFSPTVTATAHQTIAVPAGALTLTGYVPSVTSNANQTVQVPTGTLTLTGFAPVVSATANQSIAVPAGALTLTGYPPTVTSTGQLVAASGGGGYHPSQGEKGRRYGLLPPPTKERLAEMVKAQREALGILPRPVQKRIVAKAKRVAAKEIPSLQMLAPVVVDIAQAANVPAVDVARAVEQSFIYAQALRQARALIDTAQRQQQAQAVEQQRQQQEAQAAEMAAAQHLARLRADDEVLLAFVADMQAQAAEALRTTLRAAQQHLMSLIQ